MGMAGSYRKSPPGLPLVYVSVIHLVPGGPGTEGTRSSFLGPVASGFSGRSRAREGMPSGRRARRGHEVAVAQDLCQELLHLRREADGGRRAPEQDRGVARLPGDERSNDRTQGQPDVPRHLVPLAAPFFRTTLGAAGLEPGVGPAQVRGAEIAGGGQDDLEQVDPVVGEVDGVRFFRRKSSGAR
jgi:hypothetical protein